MSEPREPRTTMPAAERPVAESFRRRQFRAPHKQPRLWVRLLRPFLAALALVGVPGILTAWVLLSPEFAVASVSVSSPGRVSSAWAGQRLDGLKGRHLFEVSIHDVESALGPHPWLRGVRLNKRLPDHLAVEILERRPVGLLQRDGELLFLDREGRVIVTFDPMLEVRDFVVLSAEDPSPETLASGLELARRWRETELPWADGLSQIEVLTPFDFRVFTAGLPCPVLVTHDRLEPGLQALAGVGLEHLARLAPLAAVDLRFQGQIVFQPAAGKPHKKEVVADA